MVLNHRVHAKVSAFPKVILKRALHVRYGSTWSEEQFMKLSTQLTSDILIFFLIFAPSKEKSYQEIGKY